MDFPSTLDFLLTAGLIVGVVIFSVIFLAGCHALIVFRDEMDEWRRGNCKGKLKGSKGDDEL